MNGSIRSLYRSTIIIARRIRLHIGSILVLSLALNAPALATDIVFTGKAYSLDGNRLLYTEKHQLKLDEDRRKVLFGQVDYFSPDNELISRKINHYPVEDQTAPAFTLVDLRDGYFEFAEKQNDAIQVVMHEQQELEKELLKSSNAEYPLVIDSGFDRFLASNWEKIMEENELKFSFVAPSQQSIIDFKLKKIQESSQEVVFSMNINNGLLAMLIDPIVLTYDKESRRILSYKGLTNIRDEKGEGLEALIRYEY